MKTSSIKLLAVTSESDRSERAVLSALHEQGVQLRVLCGPNAADWFVNRGIHAAPVSYPSRVARKTMSAIREETQSFKPHILHAFTNRALSNAIPAIRGHDAALVAYRGTMGHLSRLDPASWLTYFNPRVDKIVCVSNAVRRYLEKKRIPPSRLTAIYKGHDPAWYRQDGHGGLRQELKLAEDTFLVGFAGNMRRVKGADYLIRSLSFLPSEAPVHLVLMGEVRDRRRIHRALQNSRPGSVHLLGFREDATRLSGLCNAFVMPTIAREGLPRAVIEAMSQKVPGIVTNVGGMPELVQNGKSGLVVPPRDPEAIASAISFLFKNKQERNRLALAAKKRIEDEFHIDKTVARTLELYMDMVHKAQG
jgi:glycosyltransferase involved in cell wall biosynthesis